MIKYKEKKIAIVTHVFTTGPAHDLRDFLLEKEIKKLLFIEHPLCFIPNIKGSGFKLYETEKETEISFSQHKKFPLYISYLYHFILSLYWLIKKRDYWDLYIGFNNLNAFAGIILKKLGKVKKVVYYVIDYSPVRYKQKLINNLYHILDHYCVRNADETWNLSKRMERARYKYFNFSTEHQKVVPVGIWYKRIRQSSRENFDSKKIVYMGSITKKQGIDQVVYAMLRIIPKIKGIKFIIIGSGEGYEDLKKLINDLKLGKYIILTGRIEKHEEIEKELSKCAVAVAMYDKYINGELSYTYFTDPGKLKTYFACGLPVIMSNVSHNASEIEKEGCGIVVKNHPKNIAVAIIDLLTNRQKLNQYKKNAVIYAKRYDWELIFHKNLQNVL